MHTVHILSGIHQQATAAQSGSSLLFVQQRVLFHKEKKLREDMIQYFIFIHYYITNIYLEEQIVIFYETIYILWAKLCGHFFQSRNFNKVWHKYDSDLEQLLFTCLAWLFFCSKARFKHKVWLS